MSNIANSSALIESATLASAQTRHWLLFGPAQIVSGAEHGGIAGSVDATGAPQYVYAEITGYYLQWLAEIAPLHDRCECQARAKAAIAWCERKFADGSIPPTRIYLQPAAPDWRNQAVFFFDLAILLHGICRVIKVGLIETPFVLLKQLSHALEGFVHNHQLLAIRRLSQSSALPNRWSTQSGRFLVKAATRVLAAQLLIPLSEPLRQACEQLCLNYLPDTARAPIEALHPTLYFLEGALFHTHGQRNDIATLLTQILALQHPTGELPEASDSSVLRNDVIAQALRLAISLHDHGAVPAAQVRQLDRLAEILIGQVQREGGVAFRNDIPAAERNIWCTLFTEQALRWFSAWRAGQTAFRDPSALV